MKTCPYCAEEVQDAAIVCKHCRRDIGRLAPGDLPGARRSWLPRAVLLFGGLAVLGWCSMRIDDRQMTPRTSTTAERVPDGVEQSGSCGALAVSGIRKGDTWAVMFTPPIPAGSSDGVIFDAVLCGLREVAGVETRRASWEPVRGGIMRVITESIHDVLLVRERERGPVLGFSAQRR